MRRDTDKRAACGRGWRAAAGVVFTLHKAGTPRV